MCLLNKKFLFVLLCAVVFQFAAQVGVSFAADVGSKEVNYSEFKRILEKNKDNGKILLITFSPGDKTWEVAAVIKKGNSEKSSGGQKIIVFGQSVEAQESETYSTVTTKDGVDELRKWAEKINATRGDKNLINFKITKESAASWIYFFLIAFVVLCIFFYFRSRSGFSSGGMSRAARKTIPPTRFIDVAGIDEAVEEVKEVIGFLMKNEKINSLGGKMPKGILLVGGPGVGKTLLAKAAAGEAGVPFFSVSGSDFVEKWVGVGASRVRDLFRDARKNAPAIIFFDELDMVGGKRMDDGSGGGKEHGQTVTALLHEMDGVEGIEGVVIMGATNRPDILDPALTRPGRFTRKITVNKPDIVGREKILRVHTKNMPLKDVDLGQIAAGTPGFTGADLENLANEAALAAARRDGNFVRMRDIWAARDRVLLGSERKILISPEEQMVTAFHEAGHAIVGHYTPGSDPVQKISIIPTERAMGVTQFTPEGDKYFLTRKNCLARIKTALGGRLAEVKLFSYHDDPDLIGTGASDDLKRATEIAEKMVREWGMAGNGLSLRTFGDPKGNVFLGYDGYSANYSEIVAQKVDEAIHDIFEQCRKDVEELLADNWGRLKNLASALLEKETLQREEILELIE